MPSRTDTASELNAWPKTALLIVLHHACGWAIVVLLACPPPCTAAEPTKILFIGNSYTRFNDLPAMVQSIATSAGKKRPEVAMHAPGGCTLKKHLSERANLDLIDRGGWDALVVQGQSQEAALAAVNPAIREDFLRGGADLSSRFKATNPNARVFLYQTWARHPALWKARAPEAAPLGADAAEMQRRNRAGYAELAARIDGSVVAPVGDAWMRNDAAANSPRLHTADNSHPTQSGSYLAALVIYGTLYATADLAVDYRAGLGEPKAAHLQRIATEALRSLQQQAP
jgi:hypothetical protein